MVFMVAAAVAVAGSMMSVAGWKGGRKVLGNGYYMAGKLARTYRKAQYSPADDGRHAR